MLEQYTPEENISLQPSLLKKAIRDKVKEIQNRAHSLFQGDPRLYYLTADLRNRANVPIGLETYLKPKPHILHYYYHYLLKFSIFLQTLSQLQFDNLPEKIKNSLIDIELHNKTFDLYKKEFYALYTHLFQEAYIKDENIYTFPSLGTIQGIENLFQEGNFLVNIALNKEPSFTEISEKVYTVFSQLSL